MSQYISEKKYTDMFLNLIQKWNQLKDRHLKLVFNDFFAHQIWTITKKRYNILLDKSISKWKCVCEMKNINFLPDMR